ncbi:uncharacterized protein [Nicotiana sylvestris]|uniref:uncharacterized protein n=1 Tax=Nicotiana sylvestris TaxID=4096 RepID=UPI00388CA6BE
MAFGVSAPYNQTPRYDSPVENEMPATTIEPNEMARKMKSLEQNIKNIQGLGGLKSVSFSDLCMFPHIHLPRGFKTPKFEKYDGHGDPITHLKRYCNQLRGAGGKEELLMAYFGESLVGKKPTESFREYAIKWREQTARVKPPMDNHELITVFLEAQEPDYFQNMMSAMGRPFAKAIKIGEMVENGLKTGRIVSQAALKATTQAIQNGSGSFANRKKRDEGALGHSTDDCWTLKEAIERLISEKLIVVTNGEDPPNVTNNPLPEHSDVHFVGMIGRDQEYKPVDQTEMIVGAIQEGTSLEVRPRRDVPLIVKGAPNSEKVTLFVPKVSRLEVRSNVPRPRLYVLRGHPVTRKNRGGTNGIIEPIIIKPAVQPHVSNTKNVPWNYNKTVMTYKGKEIIEEVGETGGLTRSGRCYSPEELIKAKQIRGGQLPIKKPVTKAEAKEFLKKMKAQDYSIIDQLRKTPAQISLLSLLIHSKEHARVLIKVLNEAHISEETTVN